MAEILCVAHTDPGNRYQNFLNQDSFFIYESTNPVVDVDHFTGAFGVFDGHDMLGEVAAKEAAKTFKQAFAEMDRNKKNITPDTVLRIFELAHNNILQSYKSAPTDYDYDGTRYFLDNDTYVCHNKSSTQRRQLEYGSTAVVAWIANQHLHVAWCGDSRAVFGSSDPDQGHTKSAVGDLSFTILTEDHNLKNKTERERIAADPNFKIASNAVHFNSRALALTRSLGHLKLSWTPDYFSIPLSNTRQDNVLIIATDGVWDHTPIEDAVRLCLACDDPNTVAQDIVFQAHSMTDDQDNATIVLVFFSQ